MKPFDLDLFGENSATLKKLSAPIRRADGMTRRFITHSVIQETPLPSPHQDCPEQTLRFWREVIATQPDYEPEKESLCVIMLNSQLVATSWHRVSLGTLTSAPANPREIFRPVIVANAYAFILAHNHPSGDPSPSVCDERFTRRMIEAAELMQIVFKDHVICTDACALPIPGRQAYYSFRECGIIA